MAAMPKYGNTIYNFSPGPEAVQLFSCSILLSMQFSLLIDMKMPTIVGIFIFISKENFMLRYVWQVKKMQLSVICDLLAV